MIFLVLFSIPNGYALCKVIDGNTHHPLPFANVVVGQTGGVTNSNGNVKITLKPGIYSITASFIGYQSITKSPVEVFPGKITEALFELTPSTLLMKGVVIKAPYYKKEVMEKPSALSLSSSEIYYTPGSMGDVQRVVQNLPGIFARDNTNEIIVRGGEPDENLVVIDGMEVENLNYFPLFGSEGGGYSFLNSFMLQNFDFYYGVFPAKYGDKISSVFDVKFKHGNSERIQADIEPDFTSGGKLHIEGLYFHIGQHSISALRKQDYHFF